MSIPFINHVSRTTNQELRLCSRKYTFFSLLPVFYLQVPNEKLIRADQLRRVLPPAITKNLKATTTTTRLPAPGGTP
jgi:hypothetical protein